MSDRWTLPGALGIDGPELVTFVGGGGKTSLMMALAAALPGRVVITTTTRLAAAQAEAAAPVVYANDLAPLSPLLDQHGRCLVISGSDEDKAHGVDPDLPARLLARPDVDFVLVEADGARMLPVKAPAGHEPVIPPGTTLLVPVAGLDALEAPLDAVAHRPELVRALLAGEAEAATLSPDGTLTAQGLARLLAHPQGGMKGLPDRARAVVWLNKADDGRLAQGRAVARALQHAPRVSRVVLGEAQATVPVREVARRVTAVVLAAGESRRMGTNKLLLPWAGTTVLGQTLANVSASTVHDLLLVTGHERERVAAVAARGVPSRPPLPTYHNYDYANGMLSSVQAAVRALPPTTEAILVMLGDQPMVTPQTIDQLLHAYANSPAGLVAPTCGDRRGNPVIIDRRYFAELLDLPAGAAPRLLLAGHPDDVAIVPVDDAGVVIDLDQPEEYERHRPR